MANDLNIDSLSIEITSNSETAVSALNNLSGAIDTLSSSLSGVTGATKIVNAISKISTSLGMIDEGSVSKITAIGEALSGLSSLSGIDKSVATTINSISRLSSSMSALDGASFGGSFTTQIKELATALQPLSELGKSTIGTTLNQLKKIPEIMSMLDTVNISDFASKMAQVSDALKPLANEANQVSTAFSKLPRNINKATSAGSSYANTINRSSSSSSSLFRNISRMVGKMFTLKIGVAILSNALGSFFNTYSSYIENLNLFNVAMGQSASAAQTFAEKVSNALGIDPSEFMKYQGIFQNMANGLGVANDKATIMSQNLTQLAYDYSSLMNVDVSESFNKLNSAMSGQIKGLKEYGNNVSVAMVKQTGLKYGLTGAVSTWDQATQATMRYITIMNNASKTGVYNDLARTITSPANAVRVLKAEITQLVRAFASFAVAIVSYVLPYLQIFVSALTRVINWVAKVAGIKMPKINYSSLSYGSNTATKGLNSVGNSANNTANKASKAAKALKKLKDQTQSWDELHVMQDNTSTSTGTTGTGGTGSGTGAGSTPSIDLSKIKLPEYDFLKGFESDANKKIDAVVKRMKELFKPIQASWEQYGAPYLKSMKRAFDGQLSVIETIGSSFIKIWMNGTGERTVSLILKILTNVNNIIGNMSDGFVYAWKQAGLGDDIVQHIWNILNNILAGVESLTGIVSWITKQVSGMRFTGILGALDGILGIIDGIVAMIPEPLRGIATVDLALVALFKRLSGGKGIFGAFARTGITSLETLNTFITGKFGQTILGKTTSYFKELMSTIPSIISSSNTTISQKISIIGSLFKGGFTSAIGMAKNAFLGLKGAIQSTDTITFLSQKLYMLGSNGTVAGTALSNLGVNLSGILAGGAIAAVAVGIGLIATNAWWQNSAIKQLHDSNVAWNKSMQEANATIDKSLSSKMAEIGITQTYYQNLSNLVDAHGKVKKGAESMAKYYLGELNTAMGTNYKIVDGHITKYKELKKSVDNYVETAKKEALLSAYKSKLTQAIKDQLHQADSLKKAQQEEATELKKNYELYKKGSITLDEFNNRKAAESAYVKQCKGDFDKASDSVNSYSKTIGKLSDPKTSSDVVNSLLGTSKTIKDTVKSTGESVVTETSNAITKSASTARGMSGILSSAYSYLSNKAKLEFSITGDLTVASQEKVAKAVAGVKGVSSTYSNALKTLASEGMLNFDKNGNLTQATQKKIVDAYAKVNNLKPQYKSALISMVNEGKQVFDSNGNLTAAAKKKGQDAVDGVNSKKNDAKSAGKGVANAIHSGFSASDVLSDFVKSGGNILDGIIKGIKNSSLYKAISKLGGDALKAFNKALGIHSPSREFAKSGSYIVQGLIKGVTSLSSNATNAFKNMATSLSDTYNSNMNIDTPTVDMSQLVANKTFGVNASASYTGQTGIASNSISNGVVNAMTGGMTITNTTQPINVTVKGEIDGKEIWKATKKVDVQQGFNFGSDF